jgi:DNA-binding MarR family transcriptional regulator
LVGVAARSLRGLDDDVTLPQYRALVVLAAEGPQTMGTLSTTLGIHPSTASRLCDRLAGKELIDRSASAESRREVTVELSATGVALVESVMSSRRVEMRRIMKKVPADRRAGVVAAFEEFAAAAGEALDDAWLLGWS